MQKKRSVDDICSDQCILLTFLNFFIFFFFVLRGTLILADQSSVNALTVHCVVFELLFGDKTASETGITAAQRMPSPLVHSTQLDSDTHYTVSVTHSRTIQALCYHFQRGGVTAQGKLGQQRRSFILQQHKVGMEGRRCNNNVV